MADPPLLFAGLALCAAALRRRAAGPAFLGALGSRSRLALFLTLSGLGLETCAWLGSWLTADPSPRLMHPQLGPDLLLGAGFYGGMALAFSPVAVRLVVSPAAASGAYAGTAAIVVASRAVGGLPPPGPIRTRPLW